MDMIETAPETGEYLHEVHQTRLVSPFAMTLSEKAWQRSLLV